MPAGLVHHENAVAFAQCLTQMIEIQVHHRCVDPGQKEADLLAGQRAYRAVNIEVLVARPYNGRWAHALARPAPPDHRLEAKAPFVKEKNLKAWPIPKQFREFF